MSATIGRVIISGEGISEEQAWELARLVQTELGARLAQFDGASANIERIETAPVEWGGGDAGGLARGIADQVAQAVKR